MPDARPPIRVSLEWQGGDAFAATCGDHHFTLDGDGKAGLSPMQLAASGLAGCMAVDIESILTKGRHPLQGLAVRLEAHRAPGPPARFTAVVLHLVVRGAVPREAVERAIALSREKYCSVWHSMRPDITLDVPFEIVSEG